MENTREWIVQVRNGDNWESLKSWDSVYKRAAMETIVERLSAANPGNQFRGHNIAMPNIPS